MDDLWNTALAALSTSIQEARAEITRGPLPVVIADPTLLLLVFQNLVSSALKFRGARPCRIHLTAERQGVEWVLSVRDEGIGFEPASAERIFEAFTRLHGEQPGIGVGLAISRRIVERHGGRIWATSSPGTGSVFSFTLPAAQGEQAVQRDGDLPARAIAP